MKTLDIIAVAALLLVIGCRTTEDLNAPQSLIGGYGQHLSDHSVIAEPQNRAAKATLGHSPPREGDAPRIAEASHVRPVAFEQEPIPAAQPAPEPPPIQLETQMVQSDLSLTELEGIALQNNPALAEAVARVEAARGNWVQTGLPPNPLLGYTGEEMGNDGTAGQQGGFVAQQFITGKKLRLNRQVSGWQIQSAQRDLDAVRLRVLTDVRIGYYDVLIAQRRSELAADIVRISEQGVSAAQALFESAEVGEADPLRARIEADTARIVLQTSTNQYVEAWRRLTAVLGMPELELRRLDGELKKEELDLSWDEALRMVLSESPEIAAALADVEAARWAVERAYAQVVPNVDMEAGVARNDGNGDTIASVIVGVPIPIINRNQGGIRRARAELAAADRAVDRLAMDLQARLASAFQRYESARNQVDKYSREGGILENAERTLELIRAGYRAEELSVLDLLSAQRTYFQTNLAYLDSLREMWVSVSDIRGLLLSGSLPR